MSITMVRDDFIREQEASELTTYSPQTLRNFRWLTNKSKTGELFGPPFIKLNTSRVVYSRSAVSDWMTQASAG